MSSKIPTVGRINILVSNGLPLQNVRTPRLTLPGTPESGKTYTYLNKTDPRKNIIPPGTLRKHSERRFNIEPYYTIPGDPYAADVGKRQDRTVFRPIIEPSSPDNFDDMYNINIGENMSYSKEALREFYDNKRRPDPMVQIPPAIPGAGATGGTLRPARGVAGLIGAGIGAIGSLVSPILNPSVKGFQEPGTGGPRRASHGPVPGFRQPSTGGPNRGGRGPRQPGTGGSGGSGGRPIRDAIDLFGSFGRMLKSLAGLLRVGGALGGLAWLWGAGGRAVKKANEETDKIIDNAFFLSKGAKETLKKNKAILLAFLVLAGGSAELLRRSMPKIKRVLTNRRIAAEIEEALDAGDEDLARTILFDAIEDEGINLSGLRRRLSPSDYQKLYRDM